MSNALQSEAADSPWHARYPSPKYTPGEVSRDELLAMLNNPDLVAGRDYVLVDVRRNDFEVSSNYHFRHDPGQRSHQHFLHRAALFGDR